MSFQYRRVRNRSWTRATDCQRLGGTGSDERRETSEMSGYDGTQPQSGRDVLSISALAIMTGRKDQSDQAAPKRPATTSSCGRIRRASIRSSSARVGLPEVDDAIAEIGAWLRSKLGLAVLQDTAK
jgi:hypothetical protein